MARAQSASGIPAPIRELLLRAPPEALPARIEPMAAQAGKALPDGDHWQFEPKLDGYRITAHVGPGEVRMLTRGGLDYAPYFPAVAAELAQLPIQPVVLDAEIVAFEEGRPSFPALQRRVNRRAAAAPVDAAQCVLFCFDVLHLAGHDTRSLPYNDRRALLQASVKPGPAVQIVHSDADGPALYNTVLAMGLEGIVGKRKASTYQPGARSPDWLKFKPMQTEKFLVLGYQRGKTGIAAVVLGKEADGSFRYAGRVSTGVSEVDARELIAATRPLPPDAPGYRRGMKNVVWVEPAVTVEVKYFERTGEASLRHASFVRIREDVATVLRPTSPCAPAMPEQLDALVEALERLPDASVLTVDGESLPLRDLKTPLWRIGGRGSAVTKRDLLRYYLRVSPRLLKHLYGRPLTVVMLADAGDEPVYRKSLNLRLPPFVETVVRESAAGQKQAILCNNLPTLLWLANEGAVEFHVPHAHKEAVDACPDYLAFDLDPFIYSGREREGEEPAYNRRGFARCREVAFWLKDIFDGFALRSFVKTTGKTGLHVFVPIAPTVPPEVAKEIVGTIGRHVLALHPDVVTMEWRVADRTGKIFIDHNMSGRNRTLICAWSVRAASGLVSAPVTWEQLPQIDPLRLSVKMNVCADPWQELFDYQQNVEDAFRR